MPIPTKRIALSILWMLFLSCPVRALDPGKSLNQYSLDVYSTDNGLPQSSVMAIIQTRDGYLWLGTYEGLARFDGIRFVVFDKNNTPELQNSSIKTLLEDAAGDLWIGTANGLLRYDRQRFRRYSAADGLSSNFILDLYQDPAGTIWAGTTYGLNYLANDRFHSYTTRDGLSDNYISTLAGDSQGRLWIGTNNGLNCLEKDHFSRYDVQNGLPHSDIRALLLDQDGALWIGTSGGGLARLKDNRFTVYGTREGLADIDIRAIYQDRHGIIWVGTNQEPVNRLKNGRFSFLTHQEARLMSARAMLEDREGNLWVGTRDGLLQLKDDKFTLYSSRNGLPVDATRAIFEDRSGAMWIGTVGGGLVRFSNGRFEIFAKKDGLLSDHIWSIAQSRRNDAIWIGTYGGGLSRLFNGRLQTFTTANGLANDIVRAVFVDSRDRVWVGTNGGGLDLIENGRIRNFNTSNGLASNFIYSIGEDRQGVIWIGTYESGINRYLDGHFETFGLHQGLIGQGVWAIYPDREGAVWIGTDHAGLKCFKDGRFYSFSIRDGLASDQAFQIVEDDRGCLWMNSNRGIYSVSKKDLFAFASGAIASIPCVSFGKAEGIRVTESSGPAQPAGWRSRDGHVWFPTIKGVAMFEPGGPRPNRVAPPVVVENAIINGREYSPFSRAIVSPGEGGIEIDYTAISFLLAQRTVFKYKLEGFDRDWIDAGPRRSAFYTNLPRGEYRFRVIAANSDGFWNREGASFRFQLLPHFWQTTVFYLGLVLLAQALIGLSFLFIIKRGRRREQKLALQVEERTVQLNQLNLELHETNRKLQSANRMLNHLAKNDALTGIANYRSFSEHFVREWKVAQREHRPLSLITIDIDFFKDFNDSLGHQKGDECIKRTARAISGQLKRPSDFVARYGGDEFIVILPGTDRNGAERIATKIRLAIRKLKIDHPAAPTGTTVTVSLGIASTVPAIDADSGEFLRRSDQALYQAKKAGRNRMITLS